MMQEMVDSDIAFVQDQIEHLEVGKILMPHPPMIFHVQ
jgi:hypothetical protein